MKFSLSLLLLAGSLQGSPAEYTSQQNPAKIEQFIATEEGTLLRIDNAWINVEAFQANQEGILILQNGAWIPLVEYMDSMWTWRCRKCGYMNVQGAPKCAMCRQPR